MGKIDTRLHELVCNHGVKDSKSLMLKYSQGNNYKYVSFEDFCILRNGYTISKFKQKILEVLHNH